MRQTFTLFFSNVVKYIIGKKLELNGEYNKFGLTCCKIDPHGQLAADSRDSLTCNRKRGKIIDSVKTG